MKNDHANLGSMEAMDELEKRLDGVLNNYDRLLKENEMLRQQQEYMDSEKTAILDKHRQLCGKLEAMIVRLKGLE